MYVSGHKITQFISSADWHSQRGARTADRSKGWELFRPSVASSQPLTLSNNTTGTRDSPITTNTSCLPACLLLGLYWARVYLLYLQLLFDGCVLSFVCLVSWYRESLRGCYRKWFTVSFFSWFYINSYKDLVCISISALINCAGMACSCVVIGTTPFSFESIDEALLILHPPLPFSIQLSPYSMLFSFRCSLIIYSNHLQSKSLGNDFIDETNYPLA